MTTPLPSPSEQSPAEDIRAKLKKNGLVRGRVVEYVSGIGDSLAAVVALVHTTEDYAQGGAVNLMVIDENGVPMSRTEVPYEGCSLPNGPRIHFWRWPSKA